MNDVLKIKENWMFRRAYSRGKAFVSPAFVTYVMKSRSGGVRLGITAGKKIGGAVQRNRAKRVITAAFRSRLPNISAGFDLVIVARPRILNIKSTDAAVMLEKQLKTAGIWYENNCDEQSDN